MHNYAVAREALSNGKDQDALKSFSKAVDADPDFGEAYGGMAAASRNLDNDRDARKYIQEALKHIDRMTEREQYRTWASYYLINGQQQKCSEEYGKLIGVYPADVAAHNNLGGCYMHLRDIPKALAETERAIQLLPKRSAYRFNHALYQVYAGNFQTAEREVQAALQLNPSQRRGYLTLAYAQLGEDEVEKAEATFRELESRPSRFLRG